MSFKNPSGFKWCHFYGEVILQCVRWYCKYGISYRDLEEMMTELELELDHTTVYRWVQHYAPKLKKRLEWHKQHYARRWHLDETYIKVKGEWKYLYRAIDERGNTIDFYLSHRRNALAAHIQHLQIKYRNNRFEADHGKLKRLINPVRGVQSMKTAYATIKGFEIMRMFKKDNSINGWLEHKPKQPLLMNNLVYTVEF